MPIVKTEEFSKADVKLAELAQALAHPARIAILRTLANWCGPDGSQCVCGDIVEVIPLAQATVSQHLKKLKEVGLIDGTIDGPRSCYCINWETLSKAEAMFGNFIGNLQESKKT
ncbi:MAG: metalloregulator ArsR/SmtB family transcription factor [Ignavibacteriae bacterium]|nr:metalloregulator ArsR/SmtB family transcription factor [Ignavibacteriota bacterium]